MSIESVASPSTPRMGAEAGYELDDAQNPVRFSGFVCLLLGLTSAFALLGRPLLLVPFAALVFGLIALRPSVDGIPVGTFAAKLGLVLATGFAACGFFLPMAKERTLGGQAEVFVKEFLAVLGRGEWELASELQKPYRSRFLPTMPIKEFYSQNPDASRALTEMLDSNSLLMDIGAKYANSDWQLVSTRVFTNWGRQKVDTLWIDKNGDPNQKLQVELEYEVDKQFDRGEWHITLFQYHRERLVAESVL
jgi:hypothetical protein